MGRFLDRFRYGQPSDGSAQEKAKPGRRARVIVHETRKDDHTYVDQDGQTHHIETTLDTHASGPMEAVQRAMRANTGDHPDESERPTGEQPHPWVDAARHELQRFGDAVLDEMPGVVSRVWASWRGETPDQLKQRAERSNATLQWLIGRCEAARTLVTATVPPTFGDLENSLSMIESVLSTMLTLDGRQADTTTRIAPAPMLGMLQPSASQENERGRRELATKVTKHADAIVAGLERIKRSIEDPSTVTHMVIGSVYTDTQRLAQFSKGEQNSLWNLLRDMQRAKKKNFIGRIIGG